jgi:ubiquitin C-terminal hydrolase
VNEIISKECEHKSERGEDFFTISVQVKGKKTLKESLLSFITSETLEGDNAYNCENCSRKVCAHKRISFKSLPDILIFALKRFDYSIEENARTKINDQYIFPNDISMTDFMQWNLDKSPDKIKNEILNYTLTGVVLHTGTAVSGHYHSIIKDTTNTLWNEFNDEVVREYPYNTNFQEDAFGGINEQYTI